LESGCVLSNQGNLVANFMLRCAIALKHQGEVVKVFLKDFDKPIRP
jgi:hypothetical protein